MNEIVASSIEQQSKEKKYQNDINHYALCFGSFELFFCNTHKCGSIQSVSHTTMTITKINDILNIYFYKNQIQK